MQTVMNWLARMGRATWRALEADGHARARKALGAAADRYDISQPELARRLREAGRPDV
jgi:hypothetical protein